VIIDEAYVDFAEFDCIDLALSLPNVLVMRTFSKSYSLAAIRLGYAVGSKPLIEALFKIKDSYNLNGLTQAIGLAAVKDQAWMKANAAKVVATRERVSTELAKRGFKVLKSQTNFIFVSPPDGDAAGLFKRLRDDKIIARYFPGEVTGAYVRITIGTDAEMDAMLAVL
jgi:histidinol-phosphate aminotransferase